jgi:dihydroflavonol-4-reductase
VRNTAAARHLEQLGARLIQGDISDDIALQYGLDGVDLAYHLAALYHIGNADEGALERVNVDGTRAFMLVAESLRVPRLVYVSTTAALPPAQQGVSEETSAYGGPYPSVYHRTKAHAHRLAQRAQERGQPLIIVCPTNVYGPGDHGPNSRFIADLMRRRVPGLLTNPGWYSYVHVDDVVQGLLAAGDHGTAGATYVLAGEAMSLNDFAQRVTSLAGVKPPRLRFPATLATATGSLLDVVSRVTRMRFLMSRESVQTSTHRWLHSDAAARRDLGWNPRSLEEGLPETVSWFKAEIRAGRRF